MVVLTIFLLIVWIVSLLVFTWLSIESSREAKSADENEHEETAISHRAEAAVWEKTALVSLLLMIVTVPLAFYLETYCALTKMKADLDNLSVYTESISLTQEVNIEGITLLEQLKNKTSQNEGLEVSVDMKGLAYGKDGQAPVAAERIKEWRNLIKDYNEDYRKLQMLNDIPVVKWFVKQIPENMHPVVVK